MPDFDTSSKPTPTNPKPRAADPDLFVEDIEQAEERTVLDALRNELKREVRNEPITLNVPGRPNMGIRFDTNIEAGMIQMWRKNCQNKSMMDNFDALKFSSIVIANQATEIIFDGKVGTTEAGEALNFRNPALLDMLGAVKAVDAVKKMYGIDGHIFLAADEILRAAGYDNEGIDQQTDPTLDT